KHNRRRTSGALSRHWRFKLRAPGMKPGSLTKPYSDRLQLLIIYTYGQANRSRAGNARFADPEDDLHRTKPRLGDRQTNPASLTGAAAGSSRGLCPRPSISGSRKVG